MARFSRPAGRSITFLLLATVLGLALLLRIWRIDSLPPGFHFDEAYEGLEAWRILTEPHYRPVFLEGNFGVTPLNSYANALTFGIGGALGVAPGPLLMRITAALFGVAGVAAVFLLARELRAHDRRERLTPAFPIFAAAALAVMRWHIHFSRMGIEPILVPLEWALATWLLLHGWRTHSWLSFTALGAVMAACLYTYQGAWFIPLATGATALLLLLTDRTHPPESAQPNDPPGADDARRSPPWFGLLVALLTALILAAPLLLYFAQNPEWLWLRPSQIEVVGPGGATTTATNAGPLQSAWGTLRMFWPLGETGDLDPRRNIPGEPVLPLALAIPFFLGGIVAVRRVRRTPYWVTLLGLASMLLVGALSEYAPHFHRILGASAPTALLIAFGLDALWGWRPAAGPWLRWSAIVLLVVGAMTGARDYFVRWAALPDLYYAFDEGLWQVGEWIAQQPSDVALFLTPRPADHPTLAFALATRPGSHVPPVTFDGRSVFPVAEDATAQGDAQTGAAAAGEAAYVVIDDEDFRTPLLLPEVLPAAVVERTFDDDAGEQYATVYRRPAGSETARPPRTVVDREVGDGITLLGYDVLPENPRAGETLYVQIHWGVDKTPLRDWTVFTHVSDASQPDSTPIAGKDSPPGGGSLPTTRWQPGWRILDEYQIALPADLPAGEYGLAAGLYTVDGQQLPADGGSVPLGVVEIGGAP